MPIASCLKLLIPVVDKIWMDVLLYYTGQRLTQCSVLVTTDKLLDHAREINQEHRSGEWYVSEWKLVSLDFTQLCPSIPIQDLKRALRELIDFFFERKRFEMNKSKETEMRALYKSRP